jgi:hypothetical protein
VIEANIVRERLHAFLTNVRPAHAVVLCAPVGTGKTTLLRAFADATASSWLYDGAAIRSAEDVRVIFAAAAEWDWLLIDDVDRAGPDAVAELVRTIAAGGCGGLRVILAARSRLTLQIASLAAGGRVTVMGAEDLAFNVDEAARLADAAEVSYDAEDVVELVHVTDGWPLAMSWIMRDVSGRQPHLVGAFERWSERNAHLFLEYVASDGACDPVVRARFMAALDGAPGATQEELAELELAGCPVKRSRSGLAPFRMLGRLLLDASEVPKAGPVLEPLTITLFGRFRCRIGAHPIVFARRRDQNVLVFLALAEDGRATRAELHKAFWPGQPVAVASQGVRTTVCRLRRAIAAIAGADVDRYFGSRGVITLDLQHVRVDARRFREHVQCALVDESSGEQSGRIRHFRAAEQIYAGTLLASESIDASLAGHVAEYAGMFDVVVSGLAEERRSVNRSERLRLATHTA